MNLIWEGLTKNYKKTAIIDDLGSYSYNEIIDQSEIMASFFWENQIQKGDRIAFLVAPGFDFVKTLLAIWKAGGIAVPLCTIHPLDELQYVIDDTQSRWVVSDHTFADKSEGLQCETLVLNECQTTDINIDLPDVESAAAALILYTSGTTSKPKGVVHHHSSIAATIGSLLSAWQWQSTDHILHLLPLHHTHGLINKLLCALTAGATCEFAGKFDVEAVWQKLTQKEVNVFMAVPTIYTKLIAYWEDQTQANQMRLSEGLSNFRLMVSGSAALPVLVLDQWESISGHRLLERYGMTEIGMAISNPYDGERRAGHIGQPLPGVEVRLVDEDGSMVEQGEIEIKGATVFNRYWNNPEATCDAFTEDGWFRTGDMAVLQEGYYKILGRNSVDIIKSGGYKISALEIESKLLHHKNIDECAVVGLPDQEWGEVVAVAIVGKCSISIKELKQWASDKLAPYKIPKELIELERLPRNVLGKVTKKEVKILFDNR